MSSANNSRFGTQDFFDEYADAIMNADAKRVSSYYSIPCLMTSDDRTTAFTDVTALEALHIYVFSFLKQYGIAYSRPEVWSNQPLSRLITKVKVQWQYFDARGELLYACDYHYILHQQKDETWKIEVSISINEKERLQVWLKERELVKR